MRLRREAERVRLPDSLQIKPAVAGGSDFLFANRVEDLRAALEGERAHTVFLIDSAAVTVVGCCA